MSHPVTQSAFLSEFRCLGAECEDTCCRGWSMQLDDKMYGRYQREAPELLAAVEQTESGHIMHRDPATDYCVRFDNGLCGVHQRYGTAMLGDACHFYPRVTRGLGDLAVMTAALSCPEAARLALFGKKPMDLRAADAERLPATLKDYLPEGVRADAALAAHRAFLDAAADESVTPERFLLRLFSVARSLDLLPVADWPRAAPFYLRSADARIPQPEPAAEDPFNLLHALAGLIAASRKPMPARLKQTVEAIEQALDARIGWQAVTIETAAESLDAWRAVAARWERHHAGALAPVLRRWTQSQLAVALFPFAGFGGTLTERAAILCVRFATVRLALMAAAGEAPLPQAEVIRVIQSLSRFLDHLADPSFSLRVYEAAGWLREARLGGVVAFPLPH